MPRRVVRGRSQRAAILAFDALVRALEASIAESAAELAASLRTMTPEEVELKARPLIREWVGRVTADMEDAVRRAREAGRQGAQVPGLGGGSREASEWARRMRQAAGPSLSRAVWPNVAEIEQELFRVVARSVRLGQDAIQTARAFAQDAGRLPRVQLAQRVRRVEQAVRRAVASSGDPQAMARARGALRSVRRYAAGLGQLAEEGGRTAYTLAPPARRLARALNNAVRMQSDEAVTRAIDRFVRSKQTQHQRMVARTEMARAYTESLKEEAVAQGPWVVGFKWVVETGADRERDICDAYAGTNSYGMGAGVYPVGKEPELPAHPNCMCHLDPVVDDAIGPDDSRPPAPPRREGALDAWVREQPATERDALRRAVATSRTAA